MFVLVIKWLKTQSWEATDTGWLLTLGIFMTVQWAAFQPANRSDIYASKFDEFVHLKPSEMGDTLAGAFSALAFVWIIVTVFMQARELREQRAVFLLQKDEMEEQRKSTQEMARAMTAQAELFEKENTNRLFEAARGVLNHQLVTFAHYLERRKSDWSWRTDMEFDVNNTDGSFRETLSQTSAIGIFQSLGNEVLPDDAFLYLRTQSRKAVGSLAEIEQALEGKANYGRVLELHKADGKQDLSQLSSQVESLLEMKHRLSEADNIYLKNCELREMMTALEGLLGLDIWVAEGTVPQ